MHPAAVISIDRMRHTVHIYPVIQSLNHRDHVEAPPESRKPIFKLTQGMDVGIDTRSVHLHTVMLEIETENLHRVGMPSITQFDRPAHPTPNRGSPAQGRSIELRLLYRQFGSVGLDRRLHQSYVGVTAGKVPGIRRQSV